MAQQSGTHTSITVTSKKLEIIQRQGARFITNDYKSREVGSMTKMLEELDLKPMHQRRKDLRLTFLYKIVEGLVPAVSSEPQSPHPWFQAEQRILELALVL